MTINPVLLGLADGLYPKVLGAGGSSSTQLSLDEIVAEVISSIPQPITGNFLVSGGAVIWTSGLSFTVTAAVYYIGGVRYTSVQQNITLDAADGANPRIDVIGLNTSSAVFKVTGTAAASPSEPTVDPTTQLQLAFVTIAAGATTPTGASSTTLYTEAAGDPGEWNATEVGVGFTVDSASSPITGTKSILCASPAATDYVQLAKGSGSVNVTDYGYLIFRIKNTSNWAGNRSLLIAFLSSGVLKGTALQLINGAFGFSGSSTATQLIAIPTVLFGIPIGTTVNQVRFIINGGAINFRLDDVYLHISGSGQATQPGALTMDQGDSRYVLRSVVSNVLNVAGTSSKVAITETTASGTITLTAASTMYQFIDANGSDRNVDLPAEAAGLAFFIANVGGANTLTVRNDAAGTEATLAVGECATLISGASAWVAIVGTIE